jgi:hypothetical protein
MESADQKFRQQKENYEHMSEGELCALAEDAYDLTEIAREALQAVISEKGITVLLRLEPPAPRRPEPPAPRRAEPPEDDEGLISFQWPDNADHAWRWMKCLTAAGIPSFLGPDNVTHLEEFRGKFDGPVSLKIRDVDRNRAYDAVLRARAKARDDNEKKEPEDKKDNIDQQLRQQKENYEHMSEGELCALAENAYDLTEIARDALQAVSMERGLDLRLKMDPLAPLPPEDEDVVVFRWETNITEAGHTMKILASAGIPCFLSLEVRAGDVKRANAALERAIDEEIEVDPHDKDYAILCPKCQSARVILQGRTATLEASPRGVKYQWICDACGHQWMDNGWVQEVAGGQSWPGEEFPPSSEEWDPK